MTRLVSCLVLALALLVGGCGSNATPETDATTEPFGDTVVISALTDAVILGTERTVARLQQVDGYWNDPNLRIPLPADVKSVESIIRDAGNGQQATDNYTIKYQQNKAKMQEVFYGILQTKRSYELI